MKPVPRQFCGQHLQPPVGGVRQFGQVFAPSLFIVGGDDPVVLRLNQEAIEELEGEPWWG